MTHIVISDDIDYDDRLELAIDDDIDDPLMFISADERQVSGVRELCFE